MNERGHYGRRRVSRLGQAPPTASYEGFDPRTSRLGFVETIRRLDAEWNDIHQILASQAGELVRDPSAPSGYRYMTQSEWNANPPDPNKAAWWKSYASPLIQQWVKFKREQLGDRTFASDYIAWVERGTTLRGTYQDWKNRLDALRSEAWRQGFRW